MAPLITDMERGIARCRVLLSLVTILALYVDPMEPSLTRWLPLSGGAFTIDPYWGSVLLAHLAYGLLLGFLQSRGIGSSAQRAQVAAYGDVLFAAAVAVVTEGTTSPFYAFFAFAALTVALRFGLRAALAVTTMSVALYIALILVSAPTPAEYGLVMRGAYIAITGYLVGYLGQERLNQEARIRLLEAQAQRETIARSLHDGYAQALAAVNVRLATCAELHRRGRHQDAMIELGEIRDGVNREHDELRAYIRSLVDLEAHPADLHSRDVAQISVRSDFRGPAPLVEHVLLLMLEGVRNVRRHARAHTGAVEARSGDDGLALTIDDDGVGFPQGSPPPWAMMSRAAECGGSVTVMHNRPGGHLLIRLPEV